MLSKRDLIVAAGLVSIGMLTWIPRLKGPLDFRWDGAAYYVLGTALAEGKGYRLLNEPGDIQSTLHPPVLPIVGALSQRALNTTDFALVGQWLRVLYLILFMAYSVSIFLLLRIFLSLPYAALGSLLCILQPHTIFLSDLYYPEIPYGLFTVLFVLCNLKIGVPKGFSVALAAISFALRTAGIALLLAWAAEALFQWRIKVGAIRLLVGLTLVVSWAAYIRHIEAGKEYHNPAYIYQRADFMFTNVSYVRNMSYKDWGSPELGYATWRDKARRFVGNLKLIPLYVGETVSTTASLWTIVQGHINTRAHFSIFPSWMIRILIYLLAGFIAVGLWILVMDRHYLIPIYVLLSMVVICGTPWPEQFNRYLTPLVPFLSLSLFLGLQAAAGWASRLLGANSARFRVGLVCAAGSLIVLSQSLSLRTIYRNWHQRVRYTTGGNEIQYRLFFHGDRDRAAEGGLDWLRTNGGGRAVVAATDPHWTYLRTNLKTILPPMELNAAKAQQLLDSVPVKFLIVNEGAYYKYTTRVIKAQPACWRRVYSDSILEEDGHTGSFEIYERTGSD